MQIEPNNASNATNKHMAVERGFLAGQKEGGISPFVRFFRCDKPKKQQQKGAHYVVFFIRKSTPK